MRGYLYVVPKSVLILLSSYVGGLSYQMRVLIACEFSGVVRTEFIKLGHTGIAKAMAEQWGRL